MQAKHVNGAKKASLAGLLILGIAAAVYCLSWYLWLEEMKAFTKSYQTNDYLGAERHIRSCRYLSLLGGNTDVRYLKSIQFHAALYSIRRDFTQAITLMRQAVALAEINCGGDSLETADQKSALALLLRKTKQYGQAEELYRQILSLQESKKNTDGVVSTLDYLSWVLIKEKKYDEAKGMLNRCISLAKSEYGNDSFRLISPQVQLAYLYDQENNWKDAEKILRQCLNHFHQGNSKAKTSAYTVVALLTMANLFRDHDLPEEAESSYRLALNGCKENVAGAENNLFMTDIQMSYAKLLDSVARHQQADELRKEAEKIRRLPALTPSL